MFRNILAVILFAFVFHNYNHYRTWLNWERSQVYKNYPGPCKTILEDGGSEDLTHIGDGIVLVSQGFTGLFDGAAGSILALDLNEGGRVMNLSISDKPDDPDFLDSPHGFSVWKDPNTGQQFLYVISHHPVEDRIEVFEIRKPLSLKYIKTITDPNFTLMNDLLVVDKDKFYITLYVRFRNKFGFSLESYANMKLGKILYYDGKKSTVVASNFFKPNGINWSPDKRTIYMAELGGKRLFGYRRELSNELTQLWEVDIGTGVDNIEVDPNTGDLWIGCQPLMWKLIDYYDIVRPTLPSQVLRVKIRDDKVDEVIEVFSDDGNVISGSTAATYVNGKLIIGTVYAQTMVCDVKYLA